jgi:hypothetical protein
VLPARATAGVECRPNTTLVELVGVYGFSSQNDALKTYRERLSEYGVRLRTGDCRAGKAGDESWTPGDGAAGIDSLDRDGCYLDEHRLANIRVLCGTDPGVYIGIVGKTTDIAALYAWASLFPVAALEGGLVSAPTPPGICYGPVQLGP